MLSFCSVEEIDGSQKQLTDEENKQILKASKELEAKIIKISELIENKLNISSSKLEIILLKGCGKTDAFALSGEMNYVFFDLITLLKQVRLNSIPDSFVAHELIHGCHLMFSSEFDPVKYKSKEDKLIKYMLAEGFATFASQVLTGESESLVFWGDILSQAEYKNWLLISKENKRVFSKRINDYLFEDESDKKLIQDLFYVLEMNNLSKKRSGYFYGYEIMKEFFKENKLSFNFTFSDLREHAFKYFGLKDLKR
ncbi:MAG: hypothetical protein CME64_14075 [Halobacteriovoraceae bacterium]|nr:hypothetical protein [Halobacteriovoraceae bacterium]